MAAPLRAPPLRSALFPRSQAGDFVNVGAIDADVVQLAVRIVGRVPAARSSNAAGAQESRRENFFMAVSFVDRPPVFSRDGSRPIGSLLLLDPP